MGGSCLPLQLALCLLLLVGWPLRRHGAERGGEKGVCFDMALAKHEVANLILLHLRGVGLQRRNVMLYGPELLDDLGNPLATCIINWLPISTDHAQVRGGNRVTGTHVHQPS
jgi:hypothetical protein